jgi:small subunit ribosomal protein S21|tara:strand:+ start:156 stop:419 length:264 start_codon:yes stop_codon:yes gene_type:complete
MRPQRQKSYHQRKHFKKKRKHDGPLPFDVMLRQFKKRCERAGIIAEVRKREYYEKPSQRRQRKKKEAIRREQLNQLNNNTLSRPRLY